MRVPAVPVIPAVDTVHYTVAVLSGRAVAVSVSVVARSAERRPVVAVHAGGASLERAGSGRTNGAGASGSG